MSYKLMPQMMPMMWLFYFLFFMILINFMHIYTYNLYLYYPPYKSTVKKTNKMMFNNIMW